MEWHVQHRGVALGRDVDRAAAAHGGGEGVRLGLRQEDEVDGRDGENHAEDEGERLARTVVPIDQRIRGEAGDDGDEERKQRGEREYAGAQGEPVVQPDAHQHGEEVRHEYGDAHREHVVQVPRDRRVVVRPQPPGGQRAGEALHVARGARGGGAGGELAKEAVDLHQVGHAAFAHLHVLAEDDRAPRQGGLVPGEDVLRQVDLLARLGDAAAREEVQLVEQVGVAVVQPHVERLVEHALHKGAEVLLLQRHVDGRDEAR